jgi:hypothetical protein
MLQDKDLTQQQSSKIAIQGILTTKLCNCITQYQYSINCTRNMDNQNLLDIASDRNTPSDKLNEIYAIARTEPKNIQVIEAVATNPNTSVSTLESIFSEPGMADKIIEHNGALDLLMLENPDIIKQWLLSCSTDVYKTNKSIKLQQISCSLFDEDSTNGLIYCLLKSPFLNDDIYDSIEDTIIQKIAQSTEIDSYISRLIYIILEEVTKKRLSLKFAVHIQDNRELYGFSTVFAPITAQGSKYQVKIDTMENRTTISLAGSREPLAIIDRDTRQATFSRLTTEDKQNWNDIQAKLESEEALKEPIAATPTKKGLEV